MKASHVCIYVDVFHLLTVGPS